MPAVNAPGGIPGVTPYLLPRDYHSSSANFVARETSAPLAPVSVLGRPDTPVTSPKAAAFLGAASGPSASSSQQYLIAGGSGGAPSEVSSGSASGIMSTVAFARDAESSYGGSEYDATPRPLKGARAPASPPPSRPPAVHADSGMRFTRDADLDEVYSEAWTLPPAYSAS